MVSWNRWLAILIIPQATESAQRATSSTAVFARDCENTLLPTTGSYVIVHFILHKDLFCPTLNFLTIQKILLLKLCFINMLTPPLPLPNLSISRHINTAGKSLWFLVTISEHLHHSYQALFVLEIEDNFIDSTLPWEQDGTLTVIILRLCQIVDTLEYRW